VLPRLAYLTLCRSIQLLALLARGDAAKDLEILVLPSTHRVAPPGPTTEAGAYRSSPARRDQPRATKIPLVLLPGHPQTLLRWHRCLVADAWT
jgi:hypothetical protein